MNRPGSLIPAAAERRALKRHDPVFVLRRLLLAVGLGLLALSAVYVLTENFLLR